MRRGRVVRFTASLHRPLSYASGLARPVHASTLLPPQAVRNGSVLVRWPERDDARTCERRRGDASKLSRVKWNFSHLWIKKWKLSRIDDMNCPRPHTDDWHLYFNMASMLWKGINLERRLGSRWFAYIIATFSLLTGVVYLLLESSLAAFLDEPDFRRTCAVGFSGVLFALKVLNNHYCPGCFVNILGLPVPNRYACWVELVAIHFFTPGTSFAGHLAGILVGLMYTQGPLKKIMETCAGIFSSDIGYPRQQYYFNNSGSSGYQDHYPRGRPGHYEEAPRNYDAYTAGLSEEEQLERALRASLWDQGNTSNNPPPYGFHLSPEEMRRQRLHRFDGQ
nr:rhomboid-related protein 4 isoform X1 [Loxodonta africana]